MTTFKQACDPVLALEIEPGRSCWVTGMHQDRPFEWTEVRSRRHKEGMAGLSAGGHAETHRLAQQLGDRASSAEERAMRAPRSTNVVGERPLTSTMTSSVRARRCRQRIGVSATGEEWRTSARQRAPPAGVTGRAWSACRASYSDTRSCDRSVQVSKAVARVLALRKRRWTGPTGAPFDRHCLWRLSCCRVTTPRSGHYRCGLSMVRRCDPQWRHSTPDVVVAAATGSDPGPVG